jgi:predicted cobalt transporter CbtA
MPRILAALHDIAIALWAGGLWVSGYLVAPLLFRNAPDRVVAGHLAGSIFTGMAFVGIGCAVYILAYRVGRSGLVAIKQGVFWIAVAMAVLVVAGQFGVQPILAGLKEQALPREVMESVFRDRFATWHGVASILYVIESVLAIGLVIMGGRSAR